MALFSPSLCLKLLSFSLFFLFFFHQMLASNTVSSFSFTDFQRDMEFNSTVTLFGNAKIVEFHNSSAIQIFGTGQVMYGKPIKLLEGKSRKIVSFSTYFVISMSLEEENGLAFVMDFGNGSLSGFSSGLKNRTFLGTNAIEVSISRDGHDRNGSSVVIAKINGTASIVKMGLKSEQKLHVWIDYKASSSRLEVRLSHYGNSRPLHPLLWHKINLLAIKEKKEMFVGFRTMKENTTSGSCFLHSWNFTSRVFPFWIHSDPLDPYAVDKKSSEDVRIGEPKCDCFFGAVSAMLIGAGFGGLVGFIVLFWKNRIGKRKPVVPEDCVDKEFEYKKVNIVADKNAISNGEMKK